MKITNFVSTGKEELGERKKVTNDSQPSELQVSPQFITSNDFFCVVNLHKF